MERFGVSIVFFGLSLRKGLIYGSSSNRNDRPYLRNKVIGQKPYLRNKVIDR